MFQERIDRHSETADLRAGEGDQEVGAVKTEGPVDPGPGGLHLHSEGVVGDLRLALVAERNRNFDVHSWSVSKGPPLRILQCQDLVCSEIQIFPSCYF